MNAFDYAGFVKDCAWDIYNKINLNITESVYPVTGYYIADFENGKMQLIKAVLHPEYKKWSELIHPYRDL